jgi:nitrogen regulatory protein PII
MFPPRTAACEECDKEGTDWAALHMCLGCGANTGGMSYYRIEGRGKIKAEAVAVGKGTMHYRPEFIPRIKIEVAVKDAQVEGLVETIVEKTR